MYIIEIKVGDNVYQKEIDTPQQLGQIIQGNMKRCHYIKVLEYRPGKVKKKGTRKK